MVHHYRRGLQEAEIETRYLPSLGHFLLIQKLPDGTEEYESFCTEALFRREVSRRKGELHKNGWVLS